MDHEYLDTEYEHILSRIKYLVDQIIRDDLRDGVGISVRYYSWTQIRFNKGKKCGSMSVYKTNMGIENIIRFHNNYERKQLQRYLANISRSPTRDIVVNSLN